MIPLRHISPRGASFSSSPSLRVHRWGRRAPLRSSTVFVHLSSPLLCLVFPLFLPFAMPFLSDPGAGTLRFEPASFRPVLGFAFPSFEWDPAGPGRAGTWGRVGGGGGREREGQASRERGGEMAMAWTVGWWTTNPTERRLLPHPGAHETRPTYPAKKTGARGVRKMAEHGMGKEEMESPRSGGAGDTTQRIIAKLMREASYSGATGEALMDLHHQQRWKEKELDASPRSTTSSDDVKNWCVRRLRPPPPPRGAKRNAIRRRSARSERVEHRARVPHPTSGGNGPMRSVLVRSIRSNRSQRLEPNVGERVGSNRNQPTIQRTQDESHCEHGEHRDWHDGLTEEQRRRVDRAGTWEDTKTTISKISDIASMP